MVYKFAAHDIVDPILSSDPGGAKRSEPFRGALALLHTSQIVRRESCPAIEPIFDAKGSSLLNAKMAIWERRREIRAVTGSNNPVCLQLRDQQDKVGHQYEYVPGIGCTLRRVGRAIYYENARRHLRRIKDSGRHNLYEEVKKIFRL